MIFQHYFSLLMLHQLGMQMEFVDIDFDEDIVKVDSINKVLGDILALGAKGFLLD
jgi:hypothetical protein